MTKQRQWQLQQRKQGKCELCIEDIEKWGLCQKHVRKAQARAKRRHKLKYKKVKK